MDEYLMHHGIKGQKWGIRRFQNEDGSLTPEGMKRYGVDAYGNMSKKGQAEYYRDMYKDAKSRGLKGQDLHNDVKSRYKSEEEYNQAVKNYRKWKGGKATAISLGSIGATALTAGAITGITLGAKSAKHKKSVNAVQIALQNLESTNTSLEYERKQYQKAFQAIKDGQRENTRGKEFYEILPGRMDYRHSDTIIGGVKNDLMSNTALRLRDNVRAQKNNAQRIDTLKSQLETLMDKKNRFRTVENMKHSYIIADDNYLMHHGIKGQKWGIRRFQNPDGTLTAEGRARYGVDAYGNMTKKGAANYYRDLYNDAKSSGYRGNQVHEAVKAKLGSEEAYQAYLKNYRQYKGKKAAVGIGAGLAGTALAGAAVYGAVRGGKAIRNESLVKQYGGEFADKNVDEILRIADKSAKSAKELQGPLRQQVQRDATIAELVAKKKLKQGNKEFKAFAKTQDYDQLRKVAESNLVKAASARTDTGAARLHKKTIEQRARIAEKEAYKKIGKSYIGNARMASLDQAKLLSGKDAVQNRINAFSNSFLGKTVTGFGTVAGGAIVGGAATIGKNAVTKMFDERTASSVFAPVKEYKDKSSALTQPVRQDKAWQQAGKDNDDEKRRRKEEDD